MSRKTRAVFILLSVALSLFLFVERGFAQAHRIVISNDTAYFDAPPMSVAPSNFTPFDVAPELRNRADPVYPPQAYRDGLEGTVWVNCWVTSEGRVQQTTILRTDNRVFNRSALECCLKWTFKPARKDGHAIDVLISTPLRFKLSSIDAKGRAVQRVPSDSRGTKK